MRLTSIYAHKLVHVQVVINCQYSVAHMCTSEDTPAHNLGAPNIDDVMSYNLLTTKILFIVKDKPTHYLQRICAGHKIVLH